MTSVNPFIMKNRLNIRPSTKPVKQRMRRLHLQRQEVLKQEICSKSDSSVRFIPRVVIQCAHSSKEKWKMKSLY